MKQYALQLNDFFKKVHATKNQLFVVDVNSEDVWKAYSKNFAEGDNEIFRVEPTHKCNHCYNFIKRYGNIVAIEDGKLVSIFGFDADGEYAGPNSAMRKLIESAKIAGPFVESHGMLNTLPYQVLKKNQEVYRLGFESNNKIYTPTEASAYKNTVKPGEVYTFHHMYLDVPKHLIYNGVKSDATVYGDAVTLYGVFKRGMEEITVDALESVIEFMTTGALFNGPEYINKVKEFLKVKKLYNEVEESKKENWLWEHLNDNYEVSHFRSTLVGTLCLDLIEKGAVQACRDWNYRIDPANFMKAVAPVSAKRKAEALKEIREKGYEESFNRRLATIEDISVSEIKHIHGGDSAPIKKVSLFDKIIEGAESEIKTVKVKDFENAKEITIEEFLRDKLPTCASVEALLENRHEGNMVVMTTAVNPESKPLFPWGNNFSWTYKGNLAGKSLIKDAVEREGGNVNGVLRFSIIWNEDGNDSVDMDAIAVEPDGNQISYMNHCKNNSGSPTRLSGFLDIDMIRPSKMGVENIVWTKEVNGSFKFHIKNFDGRRNKGFKAEVAYKDAFWRFEYNQELMGTLSIGCINIATDGTYTFETDLPYFSETEQKTIYGLETNKFHRVNLVCHSPNHWDDKTHGHKHHFFMLDKCKADEDVRTYHTENLVGDLHDVRKVLDVVGLQLTVNPTEDHLAGIGFNATVPDTLILKLTKQDNKKEVIKVKF